MSRFLKLALACGVTAALCTAVPGIAQEKFPGVGRPATRAELNAWDIDVRADFAGLPKGSGSVRKGEEIWEAKCASCHGAFGESNTVFAPIVGGTTKEDSVKGSVAALGRPEQQRTTLMKLSQLSTLWDYVNRAMPWTAPRSLSVEEVYATVAYMLNLAYIVPDDFVLSDANIGEVQKRLPNRNHMTQGHGLWDVKGKPDVRNTACMKDCPGGKVASELPAYARTAHGNLAEQTRAIGPVRGIATVSPAAAQSAAPAAAPSARVLAESSGCLACHGLSAKVIGPGLNEIAAKYKSDGGAESRLAERVKSGGQGVWGTVPMPANAHLKEDDIRSLVKWILGGAG
jgi:S-disulfanyl-L-cysteine oxidoreductase SoxD